MEDTPWRHISETLADIDRNEMCQMYVLPWECDLTPPATQPLNPRDYRRASHRGHTRLLHNTRTTLDQSESGFYCHFRTRGSTIALNIVLLASFVLICTVVALLILAFNQRQTIQNTGHITIENEEEERDLTTLPGPSNESTSISPSISLQGLGDVISETDQLSSKLATTEASSTTNLLTTPLEITQGTGKTIQNTGHITVENEEEERDLTILPGPSNESTSISPSISLQGLEDVISETDQFSLKLATTEASTTTNLLTTPLEITQETGCIPIPILSCRKYLSYNTTSFPNRFGLSQTASEGASLYYQFSLDIGPHCHPDAKRVLCRILFSTCYQPLISTNLVPLPCRSLCEAVGASCMEDRVFNDTWVRICHTLPESSSEEVCFGNSLLSSQDIPQRCSSSPCQNGGTCFEVTDQPICRCSDRFYGITCQNEFEDPCSSHLCVNGGTCEAQRSPFGFSFYICNCLPNYHGRLCEHVIGTTFQTESPTLGPPGGSSVQCQVIPAECQSVLSHNSSHGILVSPDTTFFSPWPLIESYTACSPTAGRVLFCSTVYPSCTLDPATSGQPCREVCERVKQDCEYTYESLNLPPMNCTNLPYRNNSMGVLCLDFC